jgi:hypothetical protein
LLALHHRARTRGDAGSGRAERDDQLGCVQLLIGCPHGAPGDAELGGEVLQEGKRAPGSSTPLSIAVAIPRRICSASGVLAERSTFRFRGFVMPP